MKKTVSIIIVLLMIFSLSSVFASAAESALPFEFSAPANVAVSWLHEDDSPTTMALTYSLSNEMARFYKDMETAVAEERIEKFMSAYDFYDIWTYAQVDWAIDDVNDSISGWHCNEFWNGREYFSPGYDDEGRIRVSEWDGVEIGLGNATETLQSLWIMRGVPDDERWNGNPETLTPGVKDQLREGQYEYYDDNVHIDFTQHTAYFRVRFVTVTRKETDEGDKDTYYYSDWSATCGYGKDFEKIEKLKAGDIDAPVISDLHMTDKEFNGNPVVAFTLTVPEKLQKQITDVAAIGGGIWIDTECRVKGDTEWTQMGNADFTVTPGEMECALLHLVNDERPNIPKDTAIELRCRYRCTQPETDDICSAYSNIITFGTNEIGTEQTPYNDGNQAGSDTCPICHFCPQPLGLCIFIWLLIILVIIIVIIIVIAVSRKNKKKDNRGE